MTPSASSYCESNRGTWTIHTTGEQLCYSNMPYRSRCATGYCAAVIVERGALQTMAALNKVQPCASLSLAGWNTP